MAGRRGVVFVSIVLIVLVSAGRSAGAPPCDVCPFGCTYSTIQSAINAAADGRVLNVCDGTYEEEIDFLGKPITVQSRNGPDVTIIGDPTDTLVLDSIVTFANGEGPDSVLEGFTITGGRGSLSIYGRGGGGIFIDDASPTVRNCVVEENRVEGHGGGILMEDSNAVIEDCTVDGNRSYHTNGGGIACIGGAPTFTRTTISSNFATRYGAGVYLESSVAMFQDSVLEGNWAVVAFDASGGGLYADSGSDATLDGCTVRDNHAEEIGGGIYAGDAFELSSSTVRENEAHQGAGLYLEGGTSTLTGSDILENEAVNDGGGMYLAGATVTVESTTIADNTSGFQGGGVRSGAFTSLTLTNAVVSGNTARSHGGGISAEAWAPVTATDSEFNDNTAEQYGGGISVVDGSDLELERCLVQRNTADFGGGGLSTLMSPVRLVNTAVLGNRSNGTHTDRSGGGIYVQSTDLTLVNATLRNNISAVGGAGIQFLHGSATIENSILWANRTSSGPSAIGIIGTEPVEATYSDIQGGWPGTGNMDEPPRFVDSSGHHLLNVSPCIDAGDPASGPPEFPADDIDGDTRPQNAAYDMGADEFVGTPMTDVTVDVKANGVDDLLVVTPLDRVNVTLSVDAGDFARTPMESWFLLLVGTQPHLFPIVSGPLGSLPETSLITTALPAGVYGVAVIIDDRPDGEPWITWWDYVFIVSW